MEKDDSGQEYKVVSKSRYSADKFLYSLRKNPWIVSTVVLVVLLLGVLIFKSGGITGNAVGEQEAAKKLVDFVNAQGGASAELVSVEKEGTLYKVVVKYNGEDVPVYVTLDGDFLVTKLASLAITDINNSQQQQQQAEVPKSDKPKVEAFVFAYCPYGLQFEKALLPVRNLLKNKADIDLVYIGAMHGEYEKIESLRQIAIEQLYGADKLWSYLDKFNTNSTIGSCNGASTCVTPLIEKIYTDLGIDKTKVNDYMAKSSQALYDKDVARASALGISGSPTFVINGVEVSVARNPAAIETAICDAFNTAPSECSTNLSSTAVSAGFGGSASSSSSSASCG